MSNPSMRDHPTNWAGNVAYGAARLHRPESVEELMQQSFIKDPARTIADLISAATQKFGERIEVQSLTITSVK